MPALVLDIETVGEPWEKIDKQTQLLIEDKGKRQPNDNGQPVKDLLGLSPYTGRIIVIGLYDVQTKQGGVYFDAGEKTIETYAKDNIKYEPMNETVMLKKFWQVADKYDQFVTYSGRNFDLPYIMIRSAVNNIRPTKDLMRGRYANQQPSNAVSIDLFDQLSFYGSYRYATGGSLHMACRAFGIETPKMDGLDGSKVRAYFDAGRYQEIAEYNGRDLVATAELYSRWKEYLLF